MTWSQWLPTLITFSPLLGVLVIWMTPREKATLHRMMGIWATIPPLVLAWIMYSQFDSTYVGMQMKQAITWIQVATFWKISYSMGVDGLSMPLVFLTGLISTLAAVASFLIRERTKQYYSLFLLLEVGMLGVFLANNLFLFFIFFEITLVAAFFLVGIWGYFDKEKAANQFLLYNGLGSGFMLLAMIALFRLTGTLDYLEVQMWMQSKASPVSPTLLWIIFISLLVAFAIKLPIFPFHTWMLRMHVEAPTPIVMIHSGILLKMGAYGLLRFGVGWFGAYMKEIAYILIALGLINILYGAVLAFVQKELKRVLAYSSISHMGILLLGIASLTTIGLQGAIFQAVSHGLISALMFFIVGSLYERTKTTELDRLGGLARSMPVLSGILMVAGLALLGLPGLSGFISEFLAFLGLFQVHPEWAAVGSIGLVLAAVYTLRAVLKTTFGPIKDQWMGLEDIQIKEWLPMFILVGFIALIGVYPKLLEESIQVTLYQMVSKIGG
ncbi:complex I subunit 4 family protein [Thermoflavimicrobium dichotomicum]|uniref:NADH-quinone oxidoreductase subunit M n=1 Tax=Thermoflavimicrobium dichotomicum TaxID=46223 RepID=A0A1I3K111_9BACL|nr:NADH-quinone oxidoreductase subunit M [Thermoflavimicrobium dichotomicum]SFI66133.1 NADH-quinone oxidoreductase subunit M [Thermoflavimicrobium dichotomicum]